MKIRPWTWWLVFVSILLGGAGVFGILLAQGHSNAARWFVAALDVPLVGWIVYGLIRFRENTWVRRLTTLVIGTLAAAVIATFCEAIGAPNWVLATAGVYIMGVAFGIGLIVIRALLSPGWPVTGVARTLLDEAIRMKVPLIFIIILLLFVPVLPFVLDAQDQLRYRIQTFLSWSLTATGLLLSLMTLFLAIGTITSEIGQRQIFLTMTKPVSRFQYLFGKWLGIMALNLLLVAVSGGAIYLFTMLLAQQPANNEADAVAVHEQVLVARRASDPIPGTGIDFNAMFRDRLERLRLSEPDKFGPPGSQTPLSPELAQSVQQQVIQEWYSLPPRNSRSYRFTGLEEARVMGPTVQLRLKPRAVVGPPDAFVYLALRINGMYDPAGVRKLADGQVHVLDLPSSLVTDDGVMEVEILNPPLGERGEREQSSINFEGTDGLKLLYRVGAFEPNFARSLVIMWVRLGFLAMLGLAAGTYLGFPVASLLALLVYFAAIGSGYLAESFQSYGAVGQAGGAWEQIIAVPKAIFAKLAEGAIWDAVKIVINLIGSGFMLLVPSFGEYNPTPMIRDGLYVSPGLVGSAALWVGLIWTGTLGFIAWVIFRVRELARVTV